MIDLVENNQLCIGNIISEILPNFDLGKHIRNCYTSKNGHGYIYDFYYKINPKLTIIMYAYEDDTIYFLGEMCNAPLKFSVFDSFYVNISRPDSFNIILNKIDAWSKMYPV